MDMVIPVYPPPPQKKKKNCYGGGGGVQQLHFYATCYYCQEVTGVHSAQPTFLLHWCLPQSRRLVQRFSHRYSLLHSTSFWDCPQRQRFSRTCRHCKPTQIILFSPQNLSQLGMDVENTIRHHSWPNDYQQPLWFCSLGYVSTQGW